MFLNGFHILFVRDTFQTYFFFNVLNGDCFPHNINVNVKRFKLSGKHFKHLHISFTYGSYQFLITDVCF